MNMVATLLFFFGFNVFVMMGKTSKCLNLRIITAGGVGVGFLCVWFCLWSFAFRFSFVRVWGSFRFLFVLLFVDFCGGFFPLQFAWKVKATF